MSSIKLNHDQHWAAFQNKTHQRYKVNATKRVSSKWFEHGPSISAPCPSSVADSRKEHPGNDWVFLSVGFPKVSSWRLRRTELLRMTRSPYSATVGRSCGKCFQCRSIGFMSLNPRDPTSGAASIQENFQNVFGALLASPSRGSECFL